MTLAGRRRAARETGAVEMPHQDWCRAPSAQRITWVCELFPGKNVRIHFPYCCWYQSIAYMTGGSYMDMIQQLFGYAWVLEDEAHEAQRRHASMMSVYQWRLPPTVIERGRWRYYLLREVARTTPRTYCRFCGKRTRSRVEARRYPDSWHLLTRMTKGDPHRPWEEDAEFESFCSFECKTGQIEKEQRQVRREKKRKEIERQWLKKARTNLKACRRLLARKPPPA